MQEGRVHFRAGSKVAGNQARAPLQKICIRCVLETISSPRAGFLCLNDVSVQKKAVTPGI
jgi:hypothetical protein